MSKRWLLGLLAFALVIGNTSGIARAHELAQNNGISVILHINPDDEPRAGAPSQLELQFGSSKGGFTLANYRVTAEVSLNGRIINTARVAPEAGSAAIGSVSMTFPAGGTYQVRVIGAGPQKFAVSFDDVEVAQQDTVNRTVAARTAGNIALLTGATGLAALTTFAATNIKRGGRYAKR